MSSKAQRNATREHRRRAVARGLVRVEVQASKRDANLIRALAQTLRQEPRTAAPVRSVLTSTLAKGAKKNAFDIFGSDLPDDVFDGVFDAPRRDHWRKINL